MNTKSWEEGAYEVRKEVEGKIWSEPNDIKRALWRQLHKKIVRLEKGMIKLRV